MSFATMITTIFKALKFLWPFIAEMFFAGKSAKQIILENKLTVFLIALLTASVMLNYVSLNKIYEIALTRRETDTSKESKRNKSPIDKPVATGPYPPKFPDSSASSAEQDTDPHRNVRERLENIYKDY